MTKTIQAGREAGTNGQEYQTHHPEGRGIILQPEGHRKVNNWEQGRVLVLVLFVPMGYANMAHSPEPVLVKLTK